MGINFEEMKRKAVKITVKDYSYIDGNYLRNFRMSMKMSQSLLADYLGVSKKAIEKWEQGVNKVNATVARLIFIFEHDPETMSLIKEIKVKDKTMVFKKVDQFIVDVVENKNSVPEYTFSIPIWKANDIWEKETTSNQGGREYEYGVV